jgi:hypothetical protein
MNQRESTFKHLAGNILPMHMARMRTAMTHPWNMADVCVQGNGAKKILKSFNRKIDFSGCYVFLRGKKPFYVGISRGVVKRLIQYVRGKSHFEATLAYRMACDNIRHKKTQVEAMKAPEFQRAFSAAQGKIVTSEVAFIKIKNPLHLYLFEVYCAMDLKTYKWNKFRTH